MPRLVPLSSPRQASDSTSRGLALSSLLAVTTVASGPRPGGWRRDDEVPRPGRGRRRLRPRGGRDQFDQGSPHPSPFSMPPGPRIPFRLEASRARRRRESCFPSPRQRCPSSLAMIAPAVSLRWARPSDTPCPTISLVVFEEIVDLLGRPIEFPDEQRLQQFADFNTALLRPALNSTRSVQPGDLRRGGQDVALVVGGQEEAVRDPGSGSVLAHHDKLTRKLVLPTG